jgi:hypothetical protein
MATVTAARYQLHRRTFRDHLELESLLDARTILLNCTVVLRDPDKRIQPAGFEVVKSAFDYLGKRFDEVTRRTEVRP